MEIEGVDPDKKHPEQARRQLHESLKTCRDLVADLRIKLAANSNEPLGPDEGGPTRSGEPKG